ncbi:MAG: NAD(P)H-dependent oxidoreductase subunit E [Victivallaceae bacterium]|nr:NAD(P)H-dependent oxidoreductase subunit E [Victivallaceae bacterium]
MKNKLKIVVCIGSSCFARGNARNVEVIEHFIKERHLADSVELSISGGLCSGCCADGPNIIVNDRMYHNMTPDGMLEILNRLFPSA